MASSAEPNMFRAPEGGAHAPIPVAPEPLRDLAELARFAGSGADPSSIADRAAAMQRDTVGQEFEQAFADAAEAIVTLGAQRHDAVFDARHVSYHDVLTGLPNRHALLERLRAALARVRRPDTWQAVLLIDIDELRIVNDSLGHFAGDTVLQVYAERLAAALRPGDYLARFGGDEFVVLAGDLRDGAAAEVAAERMRKTLSRPIAIAGSEITITTSVGLAVAGDDTTAEDLLKHADVALHHAKQAGGSRVRTFTPDLLTEVVTRLRTETDLRTALRDDQLRVFYQPIVDLGTGTTVGAEALVRWLRPGRGLVTPAEFIPISEATGLVEEIGAWVMDRAAAEAARWAAEGRALRVGVNLAQRQLASTGLPALVDDVLERHGLAPELLAVELTESAVLADRMTAVDNLRQLRDRGVAIAIDDFGTGYSSMAHLRALPTDIVKIDRSFVSGIGWSSADLAVTGALIEVCRALGKTVVAVGVETETQLDLLRDLGCDQAQGFLFSPAVIALRTEAAEGAWGEIVLGHP